MLNDEFDRLIVLACDHHFDDCRVKRFTGGSRLETVIFDKRPPAAENRGMLARRDSDHLVNEIPVEFFALSDGVLECWLLDGQQSREFCVVKLSHGSEDVVL